MAGHRPRPATAPSHPNATSSYPKGGAARWRVLADDASAARSTSSQLLARAEAADQEPLPEGLSIPEELSRREERLAAIRQAKEQIEARAAERDAQEKADYIKELNGAEHSKAREIYSRWMSQSSSWEDYFEAKEMRIEAALKFDFAASWLKYGGEAAPSK